MHQLFDDNNILIYNNHLLALDCGHLSSHLPTSSESCIDFIIFMIALIKRQLSSFLKDKQRMYPGIRKLSTQVLAWMLYFKRMYPRHWYKFRKFDVGEIGDFVLIKWREGINVLSFFHTALKTIGSTLFTSEMVNEGILLAKSQIGDKGDYLVHDWEFLQSLEEQKKDNLWKDNNWMHNGVFLTLSNWIDPKIEDRNILEEIFDNLNWIAKSNEADEMDERIISFMYGLEGPQLAISSIYRGQDSIRESLMNSSIQSSAERSVSELKLGNLRQIVIKGKYGSIIRFFQDDEVVLMIETSHYLMFYEDLE